MGRYPETIRSGSRGDSAKWLQRLLNKAGAKPLLTEDGAIGPLSVKAIAAFQLSKKLQQDGVSGPATWGALLPDTIYYRQNDPAWGAQVYTSVNNKSQTIANSGCGPTSMAMAVASLCKNGVKPPELCQWAVNKGFRTANSGTSHSYFAEQAKVYGLKCTQTTSLDTVKAALNNGAVVVANMGPGYFTKGGHYIIVWTYNPFSGTLYTLDPASAARPSCSSALMQREAKRYFIIGK